MNKQKNQSWKRINRGLTTAVAAAIGLMIAVILFFNFIPGFGFYIVKTGSMAPTINPGDMIFTLPPGDSVKPGEIITFKLDKNVMVTHRVLAVKSGKIETRGDANEDPDGFGLSMSQVEGKYFFRVPAAGLITSILHTKKGWFMIVIVPSIILVLWLVIEIIKEVFKESKPAAVPAQGGLQTLSSSSQPPVRMRTPAGNNNKVFSKGLPSEEVVRSIRKDLKYLLKDVY